ARTAEGDFRPVLVLTADTTWEARERALQRGAHDFVTKPFEAAEVLLRVERLLETRLLHAEERTARARAERATEERERLLAVVAHDLRNPLAVVAMYAETMQLRLGDRAGGGEAAALLEESCETILRNTVGMQRLVEDLLDASALQDGAFRVHRIVQPLGEPFDGAARTLGPLAEARGVTFTIVSEAGAADENGALDRPRVEQLLSNLGGNAIRFTPTGGRVEVRYAVIDDRLVVSVSDEGPGIAPEDADHLFTAFWRGAHANGRGGAGLGLWIAKGIVDAHGGTLAVESTPGRGATFRFTLPLHTAPSETAAP
ncbi:MAG: hybrid sensor histidine kinase/response regulator, partial [Gemmatimonadaceae bacterium]|nr:hybrid sensor histidine kinase/response regulator [Gemmatimonadaceae bacterium]